MSALLLRVQLFHPSGIFEYFDEFSLVWVIWVHLVYLYHIHLLFSFNFSEIHCLVPPSLTRVLTWDPPDFFYSKNWWKKKPVSVQCFCHLWVFLLSLGCQHYSVKQRNLIMFKQLEQCLISFDSQVTGESHNFGDHLGKNTGQELLSTVWMQLHCYKW